MKHPAPAAVIPLNRNATMRFNNATSYAIHALAAHLTAKERGIPQRVLPKLLRPRETSGILKSGKAPSGGYRLARAPRDIILLAHRGGGRVAAKPGGFELLQGNRLGEKPRAAWDRADDETRRQLGEVRLSDLAGKG